MYFLKSASWVLLFLLAQFGNVSAQVGPCYGNPQGTGGACIGDTVTFYSNASACTTCTYSWSQSGGYLNLIAGGTQSSQTATYTFNHPFNGAGHAPVTCTYADTAGTYCTGGYTTDIWDVTVVGQTQMTIPQLINGPFDGDTSKVWIYERYQVNALPYFDFLGRSYSVQGGTLLNVVMNNMGFYGYSDDTLYIKWNNVANRQIECQGPLTLSQPWGNPFPVSCWNYAENIPAEALVDAFAHGTDSLCPGDTATYYTTPVPSATYTWSVNGGNLISGQGTAQIEVVWNTLPGWVSVNRNISGTITIDTLDIHSTSFPTPSLFPPDTNYCIGTPLTLDAGAASTWSWSTGATTQSIVVNDSGTYSVTANQVFCGANVSISDTVRVHRVTPLVPDLGPDYVFCTDTIQFLSPGPGFNKVCWLGFTAHNPIFQTIVPGEKTVATIDTNGCAGADTIFITGVNPPMVNLGPNQNFCTGDSLLLDAGNAGSDYNWSTGDTTQMVYASVAGTFSVEVNDSGCVRHDSITLASIAAPSINLGTDSTYCASDSLLLDAGNPGATYNWSNGATSQITYYTTPGYAIVTVDLNGCSNTDSLNLVELSDCVWPGDCDHDGVANNNDVLALGTVYGQTGPTRTNASLNWIGQEALDWSTNVNVSTNTKHCDSDGNGTTNADDTLAITLNYNLTHNKTGGIQTGVPILLIAESDSLLAGDTAYFRLELGDVNSPADSVYGIAFTLNYDTSLVNQEGLLWADYTSCWLGNSGHRLTFTHDLQALSRTELAITRINQLDTSGYGQLARFAFSLKTDITSSGQSPIRPLYVSMSNVRLVDHQLEDIEASSLGGSVVVSQQGLAVQDPQEVAQLLARPNPADEIVYLSLSGRQIASYQLYDLRGSLLRSGKELDQREVKVTTMDLAEGIYLVQVEDRQGRRYHARLCIH